MTQESIHTAASGPRPSDKWIPWYFVLFFVVIAAVNAVFVTLALKSFNGVTQENAYEKGLAYNEVLAARRAQDALGWRAEISADVTGPTSAALQVRLRDAEGAPLSGAIAEAALIRPTSAGQDFIRPLTETAPAGTYAAPVEFPLPGQWDVQLRVQHDGQEYRQTQRIFLKE